MSGYTTKTSQGVTATVEGFDELFKAMDAIAEEVGKAKTDRIWRKAVGFAMYPVLEMARQLAPYDTGITHDHIYMSTKRPTGRDKASSSYRGESVMARVTVSAVRDESTKHTTITRKGKEHVTYKKSPAVISKEFGNAKTAAKPFMRPALDANIINIQERLGKAIWYEMNWGKYAKKVE